MSFLIFSLLLLNTQNLNPLNLTLSFLMISGVVSVVALSSVGKWFFYVFMLFYLGGMMIMFVYVVSLLNTEKFVLLKLGAGALYLVALSLILITDMLSWETPKSFFSNVYKPFELMSSPFLALVLLVILIAVVKLCDSWKGSLKSKVNE